MVKLYKQEMKNTTFRMMIISRSEREGWDLKGARGRGVVIGNIVFVKLGAGSKGFIFIITDPTHALYMLICIYKIFQIGKKKLKRT